jgi:hypothetical protein
MELTFHVYGSRLGGTGRVGVGGTTVAVTVTGHYRYPEVTFRVHGTHWVLESDEFAARLEGDSVLVTDATDNHERLRFRRATLSGRAPPN